MIGQIRVVIALLMLLVLAGCSSIAGETVLQIESEQQGMETMQKPITSFPHQGFIQLLERYVDAEGRVNYQAWYDDPDSSKQLDDYLALVSAHSPESDPQMFNTPAERLAFWVNAYNAWVIKAILSHWPLESVHDVKARIEIVRGFGFFYSLKIQVGGEQTNLYNLERNKILKKIEEPRLHFVLNCGSESCPPLRPIPPASDDMEATLQLATWEFLRKSETLQVDHDQQLVRLSEIFDWYQKDFVAGADALGVDYRNKAQAVIRYLQSVAPPELQDDLNKADSYKLAYFDYDWRVNATAEPSGG